MKSLLKSYLSLLVCVCAGLFVGCSKKEEKPAASTTTESAKSEEKPASEGGDDLAQILNTATGGEGDKPVASTAEQPKATH